VDNPQDGTSLVDFQCILAETLQGQVLLKLTEWCLLSDEARVILAQSGSTVLTGELLLPKG
jgi:hypothetical protein